MSRPFITPEQAADAAAQSKAWRQYAADLRTTLPVPTSRAAAAAGGSLRPARLAALRALQRSREVASIALRYAESLPGYYAAEITADGLLLVLVSARKAERDARRGAWHVLAEYPPDPRAFAFPQRREAATFMRAAVLDGLAHAVALRKLSPATLPALQAELFPLVAMGMKA